MVNTRNGIPRHLHSKDLGICPDCGAKLERRRQPFTILEVYGIAMVIALMAATTVSVSADPGHRTGTLIMHSFTLGMMLWGLSSAHTEKVGFLCLECARYSMQRGLHSSNHPGPWPVIMAAMFLSTVFFFLMIGVTQPRGSRGPLLVGTGVVLLLLGMPLLYPAMSGVARRAWRRPAKSAPEEGRKDRPSPLYEATEEP